MCPETKNVRIMTAIQLNAEIYRALGTIAEDETLLEKVLAFVKSLKPVKKEKVRREMPAEFKKLRGIVSVTAEEMAQDEHLAHIMER